MNQTELIKKASKRDEQNDFSYRIMKLALNALVNTIKETVLSGKEVYIRDFGTFYLDLRGKRQGRNINTGTFVEIPPRYVPAFRPGTEFKNDAARKNVPECMFKDEDTNQNRK